jgi:hypothetical protein
MQKLLLIKAAQCLHFQAQIVVEKQTKFGWEYEFYNYNGFCAVMIANLIRPIW